MAKTNRKWIDLDWTSSYCLRAQDIPYDDTYSIAGYMGAIPATTAISFTIGSGSSPTVTNYSLNFGSEDIQSLSWSEGQQQFFLSTTLEISGGLIAGTIASSGDITATGTITAAAFSGTSLALSGASDALLTLTSSTDGKELLKFNTDRTWSFFQSGTGDSTALDLKCAASAKYFHISNMDGERIASFYADTAATAGNAVLFCESRFIIGDSGNVTTTPSNVATSATTASISDYSGHSITTSWNPTIDSGVTVTLPNLYGIKVNTVTKSVTGSGTGTVTTAYGIYVDAPTAGTTNFAACFDGVTRIQREISSNSNLLQIRGTGSARAGLMIEGAGGAQIEYRVNGVLGWTQYSQNTSHMAFYTQVSGSQGNVFVLRGGENKGGAIVSRLAVGTTTVPASGDELQVTGSITASGQIKSTQATGTAPLTVSSTTVVTNLNADMVDGLHSSSFMQKGPRTWNIVTTGWGTTICVANNGYIFQAPGEGHYFQMPSSASVGDVVVVINHPVDGNEISILPPSSSTGYVFIGQAYVYEAEGSRFSSTSVGATVHLVCIDASGPIWLATQVMGAFNVVI